VLLAGLCSLLCVVLKLRMSHCLYLLHKLLLWLLCVLYSSYLIFYRGPLPLPGCYPMILIMIEIRATLLLLVNPCIPLASCTHLCIYHLKRRHFVASYVQPVMQQQLFKKNFCNQSRKLQMISIMNGSHCVPTTKSTLFVVNKDEWDTEEDTGKSMKNALHVRRYGLKWRWTVKKSSL